MAVRSDITNETVTDFWGVDLTANPEGIVIHMGTESSITVHFDNAGSATHTIHAGDDAIGFGHGNGTDGEPGVGNTRTIVPDTIPYTIEFYCHDHGQTAQPFSTNPPAIAPPACGQ